MANLRSIIAALLPVLAWCADGQPLTPSELAFGHAAAGAAGCTAPSVVYLNIQPTGYYLTNDDSYELNVYWGAAAGSGPMWYGLYLGGTNLVGAGVDYWSQIVTNQLPVSYTVIASNLCGTSYTTDSVSLPFAYPALYLNADLGTFSDYPPTTPTTDGSAVEYWQDQSTNYNHHILTTFPASTWSAGGLNGHDTITLGASGTGMGTAGFTPDTSLNPAGKWTGAEFQPAYVFVVARCTNTTILAGDQALTGASTTTVVNLMVGSGSVLITDEQGNTLLSGSYAGALGQWNLFEYFLDGTNSAIRANGQVLAAGNIATPTNTFNATTYIGDPQQLLASSQFDVACVIAYGATLTTNQVRAVETTLNDDYNLY